MSNELAVQYAQTEEDFAYRAESLLSTIAGVLALYLPGADQKITMLVGRGASAEIKFSGTITQESIMDVIAHLSFYKKYFPKTESAPDARTPETIVAQLRAILADDRASRAA